MKKQLLFNLTQSLFKKMTLRMAAFAVLFLLTVQSSFAQQWDILGNEVQIASASTTGTSIVVLNESGNEIPYVAFLESNIPRVKKRGTNGIWSQVGGDIDVALNSTYPYLNIFADANGKLFVSYILGDKKVYVKTYNTATTNWEPLNNDANNKMVSSANGVYVASTNFKSTRSYMAFDSSNDIYIAYTADGICNVKKYNKTTNIWESFGNTIGSTTTPLYIASQKIIFDEAGTLWVGVVTASGFGSTAGNIKLFKYNTGTSTFDDTASTTNPTNSVRELDMAVIKGTGTTSGRIAVAVNNTTDGTRGVVSLYDKVANSWTSANVGYGNKAATYIHIISDDFGNLYCNWVDQTASVGTSTCAVKKLNAGTTTPWYEIKNPATVRGVDEPTGNTNLGIASGSTAPHIIYTKANSAAISTPIVRKYVAPVGTGPVIVSFSPAFTATTPLPSVAFTISGTNFTGATDVSFGGNPVTSFVVASDSSITGTTSATPVANLTITVTTPNGTATVTGTAPSALSYPSAVSTYNGGPWAPTVTAPSTLIYSVSPALPAGLSFNLGTGTISGQSTTAVPSTPYTITATNTFGSTTATINFATGIAPSTLTYAQLPAAAATSFNFVVSTAITSLTPALTAGSPATYSVSPSLPAGLTLDTATGIVSGTPSAVTASTVYTFTATNTYGFTIKAITIAIGTPPSALSYTAPATFLTGAAITPLNPTITAGSGTVTYSILPALPTGLAIASSTGIISGTPTADTASATYTVTGTTAFGTTTTDITFAVSAALATDSFKKDNSVKAYPNPTTDSVTVTLANNAVVQKIAVYNSLGQLVRTEAKNTVSLQNLANGNYYLTIYTSEGNFSKKIIKK
jgi:hypothetical protein